MGAWCPTHLAHHLPGEERPTRACRSLRLVSLYAAERGSTINSNICINTQGAPITKVSLQVATYAFHDQASTAFEIARTTSRIALTLVPVLLLGRGRSRRIVNHAHIHGIEISEERRAEHLKKLKYSTRLLQILTVIPFLLFWATIVASLEQTPLTGR